MALRVSIQSRNIVNLGQYPIFMPGLNREKSHTRYTPYNAKVY